MAHTSRTRRTEQRIVAAATRLFLRDGYASTSLAAVAAAAGVSERTVYVRFGTKVALFQRVIQVGVVGDVDPVPLPERPWSIASMTAPTLDDRILAFADGVSDMHERLGPLMSVNGEVEPSERLVQESAGVARADTSHSCAPSGSAPNATVFFLRGRRLTGSSRRAPCWPPRRRDC